MADTANQRAENQSKENERLIIDYNDVNYKDEFNVFIHNLPRYIQEYIISLFPIATWIGRYNLQWLIRDLIAGATVGVVIVPQGMGYAKIAQLTPEYGLYTAFVGLCVYCLFATSKDISIGPTAVMSLLIGQAVTKITKDDPTITGPEIAAGMALFTGIIAMFIGLARLGIIVDFIPGPAIAGFMTGSAITISIGQLPKLFGIKSVNTQDSPYLIFGNFFKHLPDTKLDVAFGLTGLVWLYGVRFLCSYLSKRYPKYSTHLFFLSISRNGVLVIFATLIAFLINIGKTTSPIYILKTVPAGFQHMGVPRADTHLLSALAGSIPSGVVILILEHVAIAKSFGRINDYAIDPNQEIVAIGFTNIWASFFGAYPSTGSFSRTAIKARSGVKTPIAGIFSGLVVILALYALTPAFYYIPDATLAAVVIHAVIDLVSGPSYLRRLAKISPWELFSFVAAVLITFFSTVEYGIYVSVGLSVIILLIRIARPRFWALGRIPLISQAKTQKSGDLVQSDQSFLYVPQDHPSLGKITESLPDGILMVRVDESFTYPNSDYISDKILEYAKEHTRRRQTVISKGDRAWNDDADPVKEATRINLPILHALIFDFAAVNRIDSSGVQTIVDISNTLNRYAGHHVEIHFVNILHASIRRSLIIAGFATQPRGRDEPDVHQTEDVLPIVPPSQDGPVHHVHDKSFDIENVEDKGSVSDGSQHHSESIHLPRDVYPFFHWSADEAVKTALSTIHYRNNQSSVSEEKVEVNYESH